MYKYSFRVSFGGKNFPLTPAEVIHPYKIELGDMVMLDNALMESYGDLPAACFFADRIFHEINTADPTKGVIIVNLSQTNPLKIQTNTN